MIRFHLDQHIPFAVARALRARSIDVTTTGDADLQDASDSEHLDYALRTERVIVTHDRDFLRLHAAGNPHSGIIYAAQGSKSIGEIVRFLELVNDCLEPEDVRGKVEFF